MGWNGTYTTENVHTAKGVTEFFRKYHFSDKCKIVASNCKNNVWYGAIEFDGENGKEVMASIIKYSLRNDDGCNFFYKAMDETMHPYYYDASDKVMKALTKTDSTMANEWREKVRELKEKVKKGRGIKAGDIIKFSDNSTFHFSDGHNQDDLWVVCKKGFFPMTNKPETLNKWKNAIQKTDGWKYTDHGRYLITKWKEKEFEVLGSIYKE